MAALQTPQPIIASTCGTFVPNDSEQQQQQQQSVGTPTPAMSLSSGTSTPLNTTVVDPWASKIDAIGKCVNWSNRMLIAGFGSIGHGVLPLILRHVNISPAQITVLTAKDREDVARGAGAEYGVNVVIHSITRENYLTLLPKYLSSGDFLVNLTVEVCSWDLQEWCREHNVLYVDTVAEPWVGGYTDASLTESDRTNYAQRASVLKLRQTQTPNAPTSITCHGANPGIVSHLVKQALVTIAKDTGVAIDALPSTRAQWADLAHTLGIRAIHISERDTQFSNERKQPGEFVNTWSVNGFVSEGCQPAELGWGTHERNIPSDGLQHKDPNAASIFLNHCGASVRVRSWAPRAGAFHGYLITHNEAISISDYLTIYGADGAPSYRPTVHYAYHPCDDAVLSIHELAAHEFQGQMVEKLIVDEIVSGIDELGVLLMGHSKNAYWYGSALDINTARARAKYNSATSLQVTSGVLAAVVYAIRNPTLGLLESDDLPFEDIMAIAGPYWEPMVGQYTDWNPLYNRGQLFDEPELCKDDPFQFSNVRVA